MGSNPNRNSARVLDQKAIQGVDKYFANESLTFAGASYTPDELKAALEAEITAEEAVDAGRAQFRQQVVDARAARAKARALRKALRTHILSAFGADAVAMLEDFGFKAPKPRGSRGKRPANAPPANPAGATATPAKA
jgi:hypothetical protein